MFASLRTRLWFSYALIIGILLAVVAFSLTIALSNNPAVYRSVLPRLRDVESVVLPHVRDLVRNDPDHWQVELKRIAAQTEDIRLVILDPQGRTTADSQRGSAGSFARFDIDKYPHLNGTARPGLVRDLRRRMWVYWTGEIGSGYVLWMGMRLPRLPIAQLLTNEVASPLILSGVIAFTAATLLAVIMGSWIASPLRRMALSARDMARGRDVVLPVEGPSEVRELAQALNEMHHKVQGSLRSQEEALASQRDAMTSQRDFIANVSHELKTPLTSIQGFAQAILDGTAQTADAQHSAVEVIFQEAGRMSRLVQDLLILARLEGGTADLQFDLVDLAGLLQSIVTKFQPQASEGRITLSYSISPLPDLVGDGDRLAQVFTNLVDNAIKFTPPGGVVGIETASDAEEIRVEVWDSGTGIPKDQRERIFERFYQLDKSRRGGANHGLGLGLPIARQIVQAHHGDLWIEESDEQRSGSRFVVRFPLARLDGTSSISRRA